ncbi:MAG: tRNA lysidine(34) synthetase TilS [Methylovulum sp.]|nr:tRNA lysidine(34) synthetase TilS [Methylovulum sp.]
MALSAQLIVSALTGHHPPHIYIGYSGGIDSHVLLHLSASIPALRHKITAVYVHHGLQPEADAWAAHCANTAQALAVGFKLLRVEAAAKSGESPEEAARNARYAALKSLMGNGDALLVAQHREDQLETVLLQLFRGSGLRGLSGMPPGMEFGSGVLLRPLLEVAKQAIGDYAAAHALSWIEDPSNQCSDYDRNFLRNDIVPLLKQRWPALDKTVARSAAHCAEAQQAIAEAADDWLGATLNPADNTLDITKLKDYPPLRQKLLIRQWLQRLGVKMPSQGLLGRILTEVLAAREDGGPVLSGPGYCIRRYRHKVYCLPPVEQEHPLKLSDPQGQTSWPFADQNILVCLPASAGILRDYWENARVELRLRGGGEKIRLPGRQGHHALKKLFQEAGIPPWERERIPLVYLDGRLAAVGERWISAEFYQERPGACIVLAMQKLSPGIT